MKSWATSVLCVAALFLFGSANPDPYPDDYFDSPLGIPLLLSGSFAEMRTNHFHGGLDIKTRGHTGYPVYAAADGWISRINIRPGGYGNALYISHPNGYMTVYAHLDRFEEPVASYMREKQYEAESFSIQWFPNRDEFPVTKGQQIAVSGNSGGSAGPHLHFEVRDERTGWAVNPMLWGFDIVDTTPPRVYRMKMYALDSDSRIRLRDKVTGGWRVISGGEDAFVEFVRSGDRVILQRVDRIEAAGRIAFGVQTHDKQEGSNNLLAQYRIRLNEGNSLVFESVLERFSFLESRYINAHVDYRERSRSGRWVQLSHVLPGNKLSMYQTRGDGTMVMEPGRQYDMSYRIEDVSGNAAEIDFAVHGIETTSGSGSDLPAGSAYEISYDGPRTIRRSGFTMRIPEGAVYQDQQMVIADRPASEGFGRPVYSPLWDVHDRRVPVHNSYQLEIAAPDLPVEMRDKAILARISPNGSMVSAGGEWNGLSVEASTRSFGTFAVTTDTQAPEIRLLNISPDKDMSSTGEIRVRIRDDFSGIKSYRGEIDGEWVLFEFDAKYALLRHRFESRAERQPRKLVLEVTDWKDNVSRVSVPFIR